MSRRTMLVFKGKYRITAFRRVHHETSAYVIDQPVSCEIR